MRLAELHFTSGTAGLIILEHLGKTLLEFQRQAFAHDPDAVDGIYQRLRFRMKDIGFFDFDIASHVRSSLSACRLSTFTNPYSFNHSCTNALLKFLINVYTLTLMPKANRQRVTLLSIFSSGEPVLATYHNM
jgi:hypothetical protein